ncbi:MAG TPA: hypothetical protein VFN50_07050 [Acidimicrobiales bacterium]|nr:hypothetical protein [Acidimicrobiales bacterium]
MQRPNSAGPLAFGPTALVEEDVELVVELVVVVTAAQYWVTLSPAAVAAAVRFLKATELLLAWPPLAA